jgi:hypothetical protein
LDLIDLNDILEGLLDISLLVNKAVGFRGLISP